MLSSMLTIAAVERLLEKSSGVPLNLDSATPLDS
jgi:hypothetical protein